MFISETYFSWYLFLFVFPVRKGLFLVGPFWGAFSPFAWVVVLFLAWSPHNACHAPSFKQEGGRESKKSPLLFSQKIASDSVRRYISRQEEGRSGSSSQDWSLPRLKNPFPFQSVFSSSLLLPPPQQHNRKEKEALPPFLDLVWRSEGGRG